MNLNVVILTLASFIMYSALIALMPFRKAHLLKRAGAVIVSVKAKRLTLAVAILVLCPLIIFCSALINIKFYFKCVLCATALLGTEMAVRELMTADKAGVYENGLFADGALILFSDLQSFKIMAGAGEVGGENALEVQTARAKRQIIFADAMDCRAVYAALQNIKPTCAH